jgi:hypothetical protein
MSWVRNTGLEVEKFFVSRVNIRLDCERLRFKFLNLPVGFGILSAGRLWRHPCFQPSDSGAAVPSEAVLRWLAVVVVAKIAAVTEAAACLLRWAGVAGEAFNDALPLVADLLPRDGVLLVHGSPSVLFDDAVEQLLHNVSSSPAIWFVFYRYSF